MAAEDFGVTDEQLEEIRAWSAFQKRLKRFVNNCTLADFQKMFGIEEGQRLLGHHRKLEMNWHEFNTYLTQEQHNILYAYILNNFKNN